MSAENESLAEKQRRLAADIARQRTHLAGAYRDIAKPILYTEYTLRGMGFLRSNPWVLTVIPAGLSVTTSVLAITRAVFGGKAAPKKSKGLRRAGRDLEEGIEREAKRAKQTLAQHAKVWGFRAWKLFRIYRRIRKYFP